MTSPDDRPVSLRWVALAAAALTLVTTSRVYLSLDIKGVAEPVPTLLASEALRWGLWLPVVPLVLAVDRRWGFARHAPWIAGAVHLAGAAAVLVVHSLVLAAAGQAAGWYFVVAGPTETFLILLVQDASTVVLVYGILLAVDHARRHLREGERRRVAQSRLEARLARERLRNLQMQLHPHFLFNALHAVGGLIREGDRATAVETVTELGELLRRALRHSDRQEVTLEEELDFLASYLRIQKARYGDGLETRLDADADTRASLVPHLILQPLVENAIKHGTSRADGPGTVTVRARSAGGRLVLEVEDDGPGWRDGAAEGGVPGMAPGPSSGPGGAPGDGIGLAADPEDTPGDGIGLAADPGDTPGDGIGLANTRARLGELYDDAYTLEFGPGEGGGGSRVRLDIPRRVAP